VVFVIRWINRYPAEDLIPEMGMELSKKLPLFELPGLAR
jgi:hypothetical protein